MSYQDKSGDLISFFCFRSYPPPPQCPDQWSTLPRQLSLFSFWNKHKIFLKSYHSSDKQPKTTYGVGVVSMAFGKSSLFPQGSCGCTGAETGLVSSSTETHMAVPQVHEGLSCKGRNPKRLRNFLRNTPFTCRDVNVTDTFHPAKLHAHSWVPSLPNLHLYTLHYKCLHSQLITFGIACDFSQLT